MPRRAQPIKLTVAENPDPKYPSLEACLRANIPLLVQLIRAGDEILKRQQLQANAETSKPEAERGKR